MFCQCQHCGVWHTLAANNPKIIEEIRYDDAEGQKQRREAIYREYLAQQAAAGVCGVCGVCFVCAACCAHVCCRGRCLTAG